MDCDNDHTEDPAAWITPEALAEEFDSVPYAITFSRHHMKEKNGKAPWPKFHIYFEVPEITDPDAYAALKETIQKMYPFFDDNALDAGRFIYGSETEDVIWHDGTVMIDQFIAEAEKATVKTIPAGKRNSTLSRLPEEW